ncbi:SRPBCC family protein [Methylocapsa polymorpha]|uniref:SRPBCC family protein n=1 Tax=Methylocapsa polymorpha TaxID=3080828 RepID=A0ABZ0HX35_9HYPH|nr:SRPBCC family protein [Methylocapsa sp. RX1]
MNKASGRLQRIVESRSERRRAIIIFAGAAIAASIIGLDAEAHGPTPHKIDESVAIGAKPEAVWALIGDFANLSKWHPLVAESSAKSDEIQGKLRVFTLKSGGQVVDGLTEYDPSKMTYSYRRVDEDVKALPVSSYTATITVEPSADGTAKVEWIGRYYRGDTGNDPPEELNDEAATKAMTDFFQSGLRNLKSLAEHKG